MKHRITFEVATEQPSGAWLRPFAARLHQTRINPGAPSWSDKKKTRGQP
jgi:hypothetical protein